FHGDPIRAYVEPWTERGIGSLRQPIGRLATRGFFRVQRMYDVTVASSERTIDLLRRRGVTRLLRVPFGVDPVFVDVGRARRPAGRRTRLLYAGRLQDEKGIDVLAAAVPELLQLPDVELTIAGTGPLAGDLARFASPRVRLLGFVSSREEMARL